MEVWLLNEKSEQHSQKGNSFVYSKRVRVNIINKQKHFVEITHWYQYLEFKDTVVQPIEQILFKKSRLIILLTKNIVYQRI